MNENTWISWNSRGNPMVEIIKWTFVGVLVVGGIAINYTYAEQFPVYIRALAVIGACVAAFVVALTTNLGKQFLSFVQSARTEIRKVVWPTRQETIQVTIIVVIMVLIMSLILWGFDMTLFKLMAWFTGQGV